MKYSGRVAAMTHTIVKIQILGYNTDLYNNITHAVHGTHGICVLAVLIQIGDTINRELDAIIQHLKFVRYKGQQIRMRNGLTVHSLLPSTDDYITYEGSLTEPGCQETVTWLLLNKPIYISTDHLTSLRELMQGSENNPMVAMSNNFRSIMASNQRPIRTNINFQNTSVGCTTDSEVYYQANVLSGG